MAADPYFEVKAEVESSLITATSLHSSYLRILRTLPSSSHTSSEELSWALQELRATLSSLSSDVEELDEAVAALENDGGHLATRLGVGWEEVKKRRDWVEQVKREVERMKSEAREPGSKTPQVQEGYGSARSQGSAGRGGRFSTPVMETQAPYRDGPMDSESGPDGTAEDVEEFEMEHQSMLRDQQDKTLGSISGVVLGLRDQASTMGREIWEQTAMIGEMDEHVDQTESRLAKATRKMDRFIQQNRDSKSSWCILILIIVLTCLLIAIIFV